LGLIFCFSQSQWYLILFEKKFNSIQGIIGIFMVYVV
jgi:hypothetical protein